MVVILMGRKTLIGKLGAVRQEIYKKYYFAFVSNFTFIKCG